MKFVDFLIETSATHNPFEEEPWGPDYDHEPMHPAPQTGKDAAAHQRNANRIIAQHGPTFKFVRTWIDRFQAKFPMWTTTTPYQQQWIIPYVLSNPSAGETSKFSYEQSLKKCKYPPFELPLPEKQYPPTVLAKIKKFSKWWVADVKPVMDQLHDLTDHLRIAHGNDRQKVEDARNATLDVKYEQRNKIIKANSTIPASQVPREIDTGTKVKLNNPFFLSHGYAGDIKKFPFTKATQANIDGVNAILRANNVPELHTLYAGYRDGNKMLNCIALGGKRNEIVWYKYDNGGQTANTYVYVCGKKSYVTHFDDAFFKANYKP